MVNKIMNIIEKDSMNNKLINEINNTSDDALVIIARNLKNHNDTILKPVTVKNGIYFYVVFY